jgi:uncharacterized membrane protein (DUF2068 family)
MRTTSETRWIWLIAATDVLKSVLLLLIALGMLGLVHRDVEEFVRGWIKYLHFDAHGHVAAHLLAKVGLITPARLEELSGLTVVYSAIYMVEGVGLFLNKPWGKYFSILTTGLFIPIEIYGMVRHPSVIHAALVIVNVAIVWFLLLTLQHPKTLGPSAVAA